ncbi:unnamed protein product [Ectocarpus sp. CCAP 1310/34]|nr:unnamed protein product [Ectocarpus sp. CCAP 1310/34]
MRAGKGISLDQVRRAVGGMLYADDAGVESRSADRLARMMTVIVEMFGEFGLTVSERKTKTLPHARQGEAANTTTPPAATADH